MITKNSLMLFVAIFGFSALLPTTPVCAEDKSSSSAADAGGLTSPTSELPNLSLDERIEKKIESVEILVKALSDSTDTTLFSDKTGDLLREKINLLEKMKSVPDATKPATQLKLDSIYRVLGEKTRSHISVNGVQKMSGWAIRRATFSLYWPVPEDKAERIARAKWFSTYSGSLAQELKIDYAELQKKVEKSSPIPWMTSKSSIAFRKFNLETEFPRVKEMSMDAILTAFGPEDAKKMSPDLAFCIEKANLTPNDKKELLYGLKARVARWSDITHPDDIAAQRKKDAEWEKERQKTLRTRKK